MIMNYDCYLSDSIPSVKSMLVLFNFAYRTQSNHIPKWFEYDIIDIIKWNLTLFTGLISNCFLYLSSV